MARKILFQDVNTGIRLIMTNKNKSGTRKNFIVEDCEKRCFYENENPIVAYEFAKEIIHRLENADNAEVRK